MALLNAMTSGYLGVTFFFVLSGFVLAISYFETLRRPARRDLWRYGVARFARIYPLYLLVLLTVIAVSASRGNVRPDLWLEHVLALQAWDPELGRTYALNAPGWSVGVEVLLYAVLPLLVPLVARLDRSVHHLAVAGAVVIGAMSLAVMWSIVPGRDDLPWEDPDSSHRWLYLMPLSRVGDFLLGILAARLWLRLRDRPGTARLGGALTVSAVGGTLLLAVWSANRFSVPSWDLSYAVPAAALVLGLAMAPRSPVARVLSLGVVVLLGEASYAFYLIHVPALAVLGNPQGQPLDLVTLARWTAELTIIAVAAVALHLLVERPSRRWIRDAAERWPARTIAVEGAPGAAPPR